MNARLSLPASRLQPHYQVVVVGSGYGGGIAASRLSRAGQQVCVLERGREFQLGEFPATLPEMARESQVRLAGATGRVGDPLALLDFHIEDEMTVLTGCGLGGGSLVNAAVSLEADPKVFEDPRWPTALQDDVEHGLAAGYRRAREVLDPRPYPADWPKLAKQEAHARSAAAMGECIRPAPLNVSFEDKVNPFGVSQPACTLCGDCVMGCNTGSKTTVTASYLADARNHGAQLFTEVSVDRIEKRADGRWAVHYELVGSGRETFEAHSGLTVVADIVILAAGALGSTHILLRSRKAGLSLSDRLGEGLSSNGCLIGFGYDTDQEIHGVGAGHADPTSRPPVGPCITSVIDGRTPERELKDQFILQDGSLPATMGAIYPASFLTAPRGLSAVPNMEGTPDVEPSRLAARHGRTLAERVDRSQTFLAMGVDRAEASMRLGPDGGLRCDWKDVGDDPVYQNLNQKMADATAALDGTFIPNPLTTSPVGTKRITVHPLGGCAMGTDAGSGVTNHRGEVFSGRSGQAVHEGLFVMDGSVMPAPVGVNPLLTISAVAERNVALLAAARGWEIPYALDHRPTAAPLPPPAAEVGVRFSERMCGTVTDGPGRSSTLTCVLTMDAPDPGAGWEDEGLRMAVRGTVELPGLADRPFIVEEGHLDWLVRDPEQIGVRNMIYRLTLRAPDGERWSLTGRKVMTGRRIRDLWPETTTLEVDLRGPDRRVWHGTGRIRLRDFIKAVGTLRATGTRSRARQLATVTQFGGTFLGSLWNTYGGRLAAPSTFDPAAPARPRRPLRAPAPTVHSWRTSDGVPLLLTRYRGGNKGPVLLIHGLGVSSGIFTVDTIDTNLVEYLCQQDYDVWLLDYRASIDLAAARVPADGDTMATIDLPEAVQQVRRLAAADSVQIVAHCFGATLTFMSLLSGRMQNVRSVVVSQTAAHMDASGMSRLKSRLRLPDALSAAGLQNMSAYTDRDAGWASRVFDRALSLQPSEPGHRCSSATCRRISFMYSDLFEHDQLAVATHDTLHELFGVANLSAFRHIAAMVRAGHLVDAAGRDVYLPHVERLALPIRMIHGERNRCFKPSGTARTLAWLRENNDPGLYSRVVIPDHGHIDTIFGKHAAWRVYPHILEHLEQTGRIESTCDRAA